MAKPDKGDLLLHRRELSVMSMGNGQWAEFDEPSAKAGKAAPVNLIFIGNAWTGRATDSAAVNGSQAAQAQAQETYWDFKLDSRTCHTSQKMWRLQWQSEGAMN
ncbi:hypothetical protein BDZ97DRAFT_1759837 [Flammula alnicola]|nr:hypothetical protein BDZ97DRAFT_1759837 [Flammula alnicola]